MQLIIVGASGFAKEVCWLAERSGIQVQGFLDDAEAMQGQTVLGKPVLGKVKAWGCFPQAQFVVAIGNPRVRRNVVQAMRAVGSPLFATLIDHNAVLGESVTVGEGAIICAGTIATVEVTIGSHVIVNLNCTIGHGTVIQDFCTIAPLVAISGNVKLCSMVEVGTLAAVKQDLVLNEGAMLGMGSVLTKSVEANSVAVGNPARTVKKIDHAEDASATAARPLSRPDQP